MNGPQDVGGMHGFGPIPIEADEPVFHAPWEARALALTLAAGALGHWSLDESRHARESLPPAIYYSASYYEIWIRALEGLLLRHGLLTPGDLGTRAEGSRSGAARAGIAAAAGPTPPAEADPAATRPTAAAGPAPARAAARAVALDPRALRAADVAAALARGSPVARPATRPARFAPGDRVRCRNIHPAHHTRLPRYARGRIGQVAAIRGFHVFPDRHAHGVGEAPDWLYTVAFRGSALWGTDADPTLTVSIDAWEAYLEPA